MAHSDCGVISADDSRFMREPMSDLEMRFWSKVRIGDGCWLWTGALPPTGKGYGFITVGSRKDGSNRTRRAHVVSYELANGSIPADKPCVLHRCDVRHCVRPSHLFVGTYADNNRDRESKGRGVRMRGEQHGCSKLTEAQVLEIRRRRDAGEPALSLASEFGVTDALVYMIAQRRIWRHV